MLNIQERKLPMEEVCQSLNALYVHIKQLLEEAGCDSPAFDASCLLEAFFGAGRGELPLRGEERVSPQSYRPLLAAARERADGRPLQYILGQWDFLDLTLSVGEGVLIPRPDTELLCETAADLLRQAGAESPRVLDLCAGSGCVALGIARLLPVAEAVAVELSEEALPYLRRNIERYSALPVTAVQADVLACAVTPAAGLRPDLRPNSEAFDAVVSNPPYIPAADLPGLMREVRREPRMALDGGDGTVFYRAITGGWLSRLKPGGFCAVEVGIGQAEETAALFRAAGLTGVGIRRDLGGVDRVVWGIKP